MILDPKIINIINLLLCLTIVVVGLYAYKFNKNKIFLYLVTGFALFGFTHVIEVLGSTTSLIIYMVLIRVVAYSILILGVYKNWELVTSWKQISTYVAEISAKNRLLEFEIAERRHAEMELAEAKAQAELYVDLMCHDINNMNQVGIGFLTTALDTLDLAEGEKALLSRPLEALESSSMLIENVRKLQRGCEGAMDIHEVDISQVLREQIPKYSRIGGRDVTITSEGCECRVLANDLLADIFSNILGNAVKHSTGTLVIRIDTKLTEIDGKKFCTISFEDNGPGIADDLKLKLFTKYQRGATKASGRGLGLYLVKALVGDFQGKVWVEDRVPGDYTRGSRFVIMLPASEK